MSTHIEEKQNVKFLKTDKHEAKHSLTKEEIRHQRFVKGLKKDIEICLRQSLRESRFDSSLYKSSPKKRSQTTDRRSKADSSVASSKKNRQRSVECFQRGELQRLNADVDAILTGPVIKKFYTKFLEKPVQQHSKASPRINIRLLEESLLQTDEQT
ncbi:unnamed protein product [Adineta ricciae]|uniref:Uncharacterized protein n=1 Tax=Adineta ricciae TaxID=249248 RepID=A0A813X3V8_ADIRI|nr:unnamed protein product [Adineta ricciae]CAF1070208.1 unnamed protein product [Adineta ricciae]